MELTNEFRVAVPVEQAWAVLTDIELIAPCLPGAQLQEVEGDDYRGIVKIKVGPITTQYQGMARFLERDDENRRAVLRAEGRETRGQGNANATITATIEPDGEGTGARVSVVTDLTVTGRVAQFGRGMLADVSAKLLDQFVECLESRVLSGGEAPALQANDPQQADEVNRMTDDVERPGSDGKAVEPAATPETETAPEASEAAEAPATATAAAKASAAAKATTTPPEPAPAESEVDSEADSEADSEPAVRRVVQPSPAPVDLVETAGGPVAKRVGPVVGAVAVLWLLRLFLKRRRRRKARKKG